jgi:Fic family protein
MNRNQAFNELPALPPSQELETSAVLRKAIIANRRLAELKGTLTRMPNQGVLIDGIVLQEARLSSEIENIVTTNDELYIAAADENAASNPQAKEVLRYRQALWHGYEGIKTRSLTTNLFIEIVEIIKGKNIGIRRVPGTKIANPLTKEVIYTPPEGENVIRDKLAKLEQFIHAENELDPLIKLALMHYQFEAIHPFTDGNGRTGRIINILYLVEQQLLHMPVLFLSRYILRNKAAYYEGLRRVTEDGAWESWILYILDAIAVTAEETQTQVINILESMNKTLALVKERAPKIYSKELIEIIYKNPYCKVQFIVDAGLVKRQAASNYLKTLESLDILHCVRVGVEKYYINDELLKLLAS